MAKHYSVISKMSWQFTDNKEKESVEGHDHLHPEETLDFLKNNYI